MNAALRESLQRILDMHLRDEERHYEENGGLENSDNRDHIVHSLRDLNALLLAPDLLAAAQGVLDSEDNTGCDGCTVVDEEPIENLRNAIQAHNEITRQTVPKDPAG